MDAQFGLVRVYIVFFLSGRLCVIEEFLGRPVFWRDWNWNTSCDRVLPSLITANQCSVPFMRTLNGTRQLIAWSLVEREVEIGMEFGAYYRDP